MLDLSIYLKTLHENIDIPQGAGTKSLRNNINFINTLFGDFLANDLGIETQQNEKKLVFDKTIVCRIINGSRSINSTFSEAIIAEENLIETIKSLTGFFDAYISNEQLEVFKDSIEKLIEDDTLLSRKVSRKLHERMREFEKSENEILDRQQQSKEFLALVFIEIVRAETNRKKTPAAIMSNLFISLTETYVVTEQLATLQDYFCVDMKQPKTALIHGMSGCGKSTLARAFATAVQKKYDAIVWTNYKSSEGFQGVINQIPMRKADASAAEKIHALRNGEQKVLIIIDNFDEKTCHEPLPKWGKTHVLFTSRYRADSFTQATAKIVPLHCNKELSLSIFKTIFFHTVKKKASDHQMAVATRILEKVKYHTYATDLIARQIGENYAFSDDDIDCYEQHLNDIWSNATVDSQKDRFVGMVADESSFDAHMALLFEDILLEASTYDQSIMFLFSMHNRWKRNTITMLLGDDKSTGLLAVSKSIVKLVKKNLLQEEIYTDEIRGTEHVLTMHPLFRHVMKNELSWNTDREITTIINNFCAQWDNFEGKHGAQAWLDRDQWPEEYICHVDEWLIRELSKYLEDTQSWSVQTALALCFMLQPFFSSSEFVEIARKCLEKRVGHTVSTYFLCSTETKNGRYYFIHIPDHATSVPLLTCAISYQFTTLTNSTCKASGSIALRNIVANQEELVIPNCIDGKPVCSIWYVFAHERNYKYSIKYDNHGFRDLQPGDVFKSEYANIRLKKVVIEDGIQEIHSHAFEGLEIEDLALPNTIVHIGSQAFFENKQLRRFTMSENVTRIPDGCFAGCSSLTEIVLSNSVTAIGRYAFAHCTHLTNVLISGQLQAIEEGAFMECPSLVSFSVNSRSLLRIGEECCGYNPQLLFANLCAEEIHLAKRAFACCQKLERVTIKAKKACVDPVAFAYCDRLKALDTACISKEDIKKVLKLAAADTDEKIAELLQQSQEYTL